MRVFKVVVSALIISFFISGCASIDRRTDFADTLASDANMTKSFIETDDFAILSYYKINDPESKSVNIYIEGDGFAWVSRGRASSNPTPRAQDMLALKLAAADPGQNIIYLGRPCQYVIDDPKCAPKYWSGSRFAEEVIRSTNKSIDYFINKFDINSVNLIGFSGGGAVAVLVAARRNDIASIRTIGGNLDHKGVNNYHKVTPLQDSLNPTDFAKETSNIPQYHFVGEKDKIILPFIAKRFAHLAEQGNGCVKVAKIKNATHLKGWVKNWPYLLKQPVQCKK